MEPRLSTNTLCGVAGNPVSDVRNHRAFVHGQIARGAQFWIQVLSIWSAAMKAILLLCVVTSLALAGAAYARGGAGSSMSMASGGALGTSAGRPGTNSLGTALPSSESGGHAMGGPLLGTD
jgi:hypothetical protein